MEQRRKRRAAPVDELRENDKPDTPVHREAEEAAPRTKRWPSRDGWDVVVGDLRRIDPTAEYGYLRERLILAEKCDDYATVLRLADEAPDMMVRAVQYVRRAKLDEAEVVDELDARLHLLRAQVREAYAKELGVRPSAERVDAMVRSEYPDEYRDIRRRKDEMHAVVRVAEGLVDAWKAKNRLIDTMLGKVAR
jgi:hypothetical protein